MAGISLLELAGEVCVPAIVFVFKYGMRNGEVDVGHKTGARPTDDFTRKLP